MIKKTRYNVRELGIDLLLNYAHNLRFQGILIENKVAIWHKYT